MTIAPVNGASARTKGHPFELIAGHAALDLVNTLDWRFRDGAPEELLNSYADLAHFAEQSGLISPTQTRRLLRSVDAGKAARVLSAVRELREAAATVLYAMLDGDEPPASSIRRLEGFFREARASQHLLWDGARLAWQLVPATSLPGLPLRLLSLSVADLLTSGEMQRLRACGSLECRWLFLDTSKNHTRRWCDMKICGNRMKARRFKAQHGA